MTLPIFGLVLQRIYKILIDKEICSVLTSIVGVFTLSLSLTFFFFFETKHLPQFHLIKAQFEAPRGQRTSHWDSNVCDPEDWPEPRQRYRSSLCCSEFWQLQLLIPLIESAPGGYVEYYSSHFSEVGHLNTSDSLRAFWERSRDVLSTLCTGVITVIGSYYFYYVQILS